MEEAASQDSASIDSCGTWNVSWQNEDWKMWRFFSFRKLSSNINSHNFRKSKFLVFLDVSTFGTRSCRILDCFAWGKGIPCQQLCWALAARPDATGSLNHSESVREAERVPPCRLILVCFWRHKSIWKEKNDEWIENIYLFVMDFPWKINLGIWFVACP